MTERKQTKTIAELRTTLWKTEEENLGVQKTGSVLQRFRLMTIKRGIQPKGAK